MSSHNYINMHPECVVYTASLQPDCLSDIKTGNMIVAAVMYMLRTV
jgi:hypothetical protein